MTRSIGYDLLLLTLLAGANLLKADEPTQPSPETVDTSRGDRMIATYFRNETARLTAATLAEIKTLEDWQSRRSEYRQQLLEMLGLSPLPERTPLDAETTGREEHEQFFVEKLHFQSRPGLYVTGNLYVPKQLEGKAPAILYVCGHGRVKKEGVSYGNKSNYQHHPAWFARNGYVCLTIDTLQLGEIEGMHHGTYRHNNFWWNARGYTPAGVEAWNSIRAVDYLQSRPEVDGERIGVTGRSGGGAYSWWVGALDDRIKVAVPVAGITSLKNHVVDGCIEGHCDCMFQVNTYGWDFPLVAALMAPRPLLISNSDKDHIFPLDGVIDVHQKVRRIYRLYDADDKLGLQITEGPHKDTQSLRVHAFSWFNRFLKGDEPLIETVAVKLFEPEQLKVFEKLPADQKNTEIHETFVAKSPPPVVPESQSDWEHQAALWRSVLKEKCFRGWPASSSADAADLDVEELFSAEQNGIRLTAFEFTSQKDIRLPLYVAYRAGLQPEDLELVVLNVLDQQGWQQFLASMRVGFAQQFAGEHLPEADEKEFREAERMFQQFKWGMAYIAPRGIGPTEWTRDERERVHIRRRFVLLGRTRDSMRAWDVRRAAQALRSLPSMQQVPLWMQAEGEMAGITLYASLFEPDVARLDLWQLSASHREGPFFLNVLRFLDVPQAVALAAERSKVRIYQDEHSTSGWEYPQAVAAKLGWNKQQLQVRAIPVQADRAEGE
jgi:dienelactone hydrolase